MARLCSTCKGRVLKHSVNIKCSICKCFFHRQCLPLITTDDIDHLKNDSTWICCNCSASIFPFNQFDDNNEFINAIADNWFINDIYTLEDLDKRIFTPFEIDESQNEILLDDFDPDTNFFRDLNITPNSTSYFSEDNFNSHITSLLQNVSMPLSFVHLNIRSVPKNIDKLSSYLDSLQIKFSFIGLTETWYSDNTCSLYDIEGYNQESFYRQQRRGGGVSLLIDKHIPYAIRSDLNIFDSDAETLFIEVDKCVFKTERNMVIGVIYRIPDRDANKFNENLNIVMGHIKDENKISYILGDYNLNLLNVDTHTATSDFMDTCFSNNFIPLINKPTRVTKHSATLIDNIITNNIINVSYSQGIFLTDISDHFPIFVISKTFQQKEINISHKRRVISCKNIEIFKNSLQQQNFNTIFDMTDVNVATSMFQSEISILYEKCFPIREINSKYSCKKPWLSSGLKQSIKHKNFLYKLYIKHPSEEKEKEYKIYRNKLHSILRRAEREHYRYLLEYNKGNLKKTWSIMKNVINKKAHNSKPDYFVHNSQKITNQNDIARHFNDFFINIGSALSDKIPQSNRTALSYLENRFPKTMFLHPVTRNEMLLTLRKLKSDSSPGWDDISPKVVQASHVYLVDILIHLVNLSLNQGIFPDIHKIAKVVPIFKADDMTIFTNYRPVSILNTFSKIFERIFYNRLFEFLNNEHILYDKQFGFRKSFSTDMALILLMDRISSALEQGEFVLGVFLDFSKAFDTVNHNILLEKLNHYGIRGTSNDWIRSYLTQRPQYVVYGCETSTKKNIQCGVPQGSILGPLLFLIYINDLAKISNILFFLMYADDTNVFLSSKNLKELETLMNQELSSLLEWLNANKLSLNIKKTHFIIFSPPKTKPSYKVHLKINNIDIQCVQQTKFLGVIIDSKLSWKDHIKYIKSKICKSIGIISKARKYLNLNSLLCLYYAFLYPYFIYCIAVWGGTNKTTLYPLIKTQKWALRAICGKPRRTPSAPLFTSLKMLTINQIYMLRVLMFVYKFQKSKLPSIFSQFFTKTSEIHSYSTRQSQNMYPPRCKNEITKSLVRYSGSLLWNELEADIKRTTGSTSSFKKRIIRSWFPV